MPSGLDPPTKPDFNARQLAPPSVLLNTQSRPGSPPPASLVAAYSVLVCCGSMTNDMIRPEFGGKRLVTAQLSPASVLLKRPANVNAYKVSGFFGSMTSAVATPPSGPRLVHPLVPAQAVREFVPTRAGAAIAASRTVRFTVIPSFFAGLLLARRNK